MDLGLGAHGAVDHQQIYGTGAEDLRDWLPLKRVIQHPLKPTGIKLSKAAKG